MTDYRQWFATQLLALPLCCAPAEDPQPAPARAFKPNILLIVVDDVPTFFYRDWDSKNPFRADGVNPENTSVDPEGSDIYIQHPVLDKLMANGVTFLNHYAQPTCGTDRAAMFSGLWAHRNGIGSPVAGNREFNNFVHNDVRFDRATPLAKAVGARGYQTGICGKWHLAAKAEDGGSDWEHIPDVGGWDWYASTFSNFTIDKKPVGGPRTKISPISAEHGWIDAGGGRWQKTDIDEFHFGNLAFMFFDGVTNAVAERTADEVDQPGEWYLNTENTLLLCPGAGGLVERARRLKGGHYNFFVDRNGAVDHHRSGYFSELGPLAAEIGGFFSGDIVFDDAETFVAQTSEPWFLAITPNSPHSPYEYPMPDALVETDLYKQGPNTAPNEQSAWTNFCAQLEFHDARLGEFLDNMDPEVRSRTVVIWTSDNGVPQQIMWKLRDDRFHGVGRAGVGATLSKLIDSGEARPVSRRFKSSPYEGGGRVPLVISGPAVSSAMRGKKVQALSHTVDLYATVLALAGGSMSGISGVSQLPIVQGTETAVRDELISHQFRIEGTNGDHTAITAGPDKENFDELGYSLIFTDAGPLNGRYKLVRKLVSASPQVFRHELYQLEDENGQGVDLYEQADLFGNPTYQAIELGIQERLQALLDT
ncbi:MAG: arylsulfatase A-like enzyme [Chlamydiales bacterium]|jgi:arylsulfatase A-like enzyme